MPRTMASAHRRRAGSARIISRSTPNIVPRAGPSFTSADGSRAQGIRRADLLAARGIDSGQVSRDEHPPLSRHERDAADQDAAVALQRDRERLVLGGQERADHATGAERRVERSVGKKAGQEDVRGVVQARDPPRGDDLAVGLERDAHDLVGRVRKRSHR